ncbi:MAG: response regulator [Anaerolineae bacterium]|nr:response regulator [Anaerolineae bacterium]
MAGERILIIDDKIEIIDLLLDLLEPMGYAVSSATSGRVGLAHAIEEQPDLILLDVHMPDMTGIEVLEALHRSESRSPVILMTLYGSEQVAVDAFRLGVKDYIAKPFDINQLLVAVDWALEEGRLRRDRERLVIELHAANQKLKQGMKELAGAVRRNAQLYEASTRQAEQLATVNRVAQMIAGCLGQKEIMRTLVQSVRESLGVESATLLLCDDERDELVFDIILGDQVAEAGTFRMPRDRGVAGWVVTRGEALCVNDVAGDPRFNPEIDAESGFRTRSILCVPLLAPQGVVGAIEAINKLDNRRPGVYGAFDDEDLELLRGTAAFVTIALENARLHAAVQETVATQTLQDTIVTLSHYLNNPLQAMMSAIDLLRADPTGHDTTARVARLMEQKMREVSVVMSVLRDMTHPESAVYLGSIQMLDIEKELQARLKEASRERQHLF